MRVSKDELKRGILYWTNPQIPVVLHAKQSPEAERATIRRLEDHTGSLAPWPRNENAVLQPTAPSVEASVNPGEIYWLWADEKGLHVTAVDVVTGSKMNMAHILGWGVYHRLVVYVPHLQ